MHRGHSVRDVTKRFYSLLIALAPFSLGVEAQSTSSFDEVGRFYVQNFGPEDYDAHAQNFAIVQGLDDVLYVANGDGVLEYDGVSWRLIPVSNRSPARSLAVDADGRVLVGGSGEMGYLAPDASGRMRYVSLVDRLPRPEQDFADVWSTHVLADVVYFASSDRLFGWRGDEAQVWTTASAFHSGSLVHDMLYLRENGRGLVRLEDGGLRLARRPSTSRVESSSARWTSWATSSPMRWAGCAASRWSATSPPPDRGARQT